jgi:flagella basal body P-ring formation protein FlgA
LRLVTFLFSVFIVTLLSVAYADSPKVDMGADGRVSSEVSGELSKRYPGARIELTSAVQWLMVGGATSQNAANSPQGEILSVRVGDENARGEVPFSVQSRDESGLRLSWGRVNFAAYVSARIAARRIQPGELVRPDGFLIQDINVAFGPNHEIRGLILQPSDALVRVETRQTVLEGQPLLSSEIERVPDIRRGDSVRIELVTGSLTLSTLGTASEPGYLDGQIHVVSQKTKRELIGTLMSGGIVQVRL